MKNTTLAIANTFGNVDVRSGAPKGYVHVKGTRLQPLCRKLGIKFAPALIGFEGEKRFGHHPVLDGVVVSERSGPKLLEEISKRTERTAKARAEREKKRLEERKRERKRAARRLRLCYKLGVDPNGHAARMLFNREISPDEAELIGFKTRYRHRFTDYEQHFDNETFEDLLASWGSPREAGEEMRQLARNRMQDSPIPATWPEYLNKYDFRSPIAEALALVLQDPTRCHPCWFKEAEIAVRRRRTPLIQLSYAIIKEAIEAWRQQRTIGGLPEGRR